MPSDSTREGWVTVTELTRERCCILAAEVTTAIQSLATSPTSSSNKMAINQNASSATPSTTADIHSAALPLRKMGPTRVDTSNQDPKGNALNTGASTQQIEAESPNYILGPNPRADFLHKVSKREQPRTSPEILTPDFLASLCPESMENLPEAELVEWVTKCISSGEDSYTSSSEDMEISDEEETDKSEGGQEDDAQEKPPTERI